ncbi:helix-turn-helix domain-containing protein [Delftia tsuruhatensis]|uniref:helix-turn-helix transcriptional regulator n=1 Tax=Delftia tsuruhatensis TaxID=180282 RepID=UPI002444C0EE|nr:helix-turn-helix transcriptional regulator [Delftia tsuruhatensis]MDH0776363.1 helix-turn-helix domain-containing protein [Delftia tsuruhatensis]MDH1460082.1 helix-turn-helix domain-containing protein [Delftia tsuruhatensis]MDH1823045.1 helix-turn-helix domain-containing protein [Delftia tsuruhatensis]WGG12251.1 helix-turn-helix domain-containing protein [Delftia tsuruhatensis]
MDSELPQRLIKARSGHGWSQADLAEVSGVAAAQISRYEQGRSKPRTEVTAKLAKALAVSFEWLAYGRGPIDDGSDVPRYPAAQKLVHTFDLENDPELREAVESLAEESGLTIEMAIKSALLAAARELRGKEEEAAAKKPKP